MQGLCEIFHKPPVSRLWTGAKQLPQKWQLYSYSARKTSNSRGTCTPPIRNWESKRAAPAKVQFRLYANRQIPPSHRQRQMQRVWEELKAGFFSFLSPGSTYWKPNRHPPNTRSCKPGATPRTPPTTASSSIPTLHFTAKKASWICASKAAKTAAAPCSGNRCGIW